MLQQWLYNDCSGNCPGDRQRACHKYVVLAPSVALEIGPRNAPRVAQRVGPGIDPGRWSCVDRSGRCSLPLRVVPLPEKVVGAMARTTPGNAPGAFPRSLLRDARLALTFVKPALALQPFGQPTLNTTWTETRLEQRTWSAFGPVWWFRAAPPCGSARLLQIVFSLTAVRFRVLAASKKGAHTRHTPGSGQGGGPSVRFSPSNKPHTEGAGQNCSRL